jgi:hypothetical protein
MMQNFSKLMDNELLDRAIAVYLGGELDSPGIDPAGGEKERLNSAGLIEFYDDCQNFLKEVYQDDQSWRHENLEDVADLASLEIKKKFPWLTINTANKLGNWYAYQVK